MEATEERTNAERQQCSIHHETVPCCALPASFAINAIAGVHTKTAKNTSHKDTRRSTVIIMVDFVDQFFHLEDRPPHSIVNSGFRCLCCSGGAMVQHDSHYPSILRFILPYSMRIHVFLLWSVLRFTRLTVKTVLDVVPERRGRCDHEQNQACFVCLAILGTETVTAKSWTSRCHIFL